jgi:hypothetical protein
MLRFKERRKHLFRIVFKAQLRLIKKNHPVYIVYAAYRWKRGNCDIRVRGLNKEHRVTSYRYQMLVNLQRASVRLQLQTGAGTILVNKNGHGSW